MTAEIVKEVAAVAETEKGIGIGEEGVEVEIKNEGKDLYFNQNQRLDKM